MIEKNEGLWKCKVCGKIAKLKGNIKQHAESHIEGVSHICHICNKLSTTRNSLQMHMKNYHAEFNCDICGKTGMTKMTIKGHKSICKIEMNYL